MNGRMVMALFALAGRASSAKILALMVVASHSHHFWNTKYLEALVERGHHVTYLGVDEYKSPPENITHIFIKDTYETLYKDVDLTSISDSGPYQNTLYLQQWEEEEAAFFLKTEALEIFNRTIREEKFDLVVHDIGSNPFLLGAVDILGRPPIVGITAFGIPTWALDILGNPMAYSSKPYFYAPYTNHMTFLQRANNYILHLFSFAVRWHFMRKQNEFSKKCFGNNVRPLEEILDNINIIMVNSNEGLDYAFPKVPGLIPVGGLHIQRPKQLPQELKTFLDEANSGVVYFSLGSNVKSSSLKKETVNILFNAFKEISPVRVLWKWESDDLPGRSDNVKMGKWFPQKDVLAHPNVRLFFTHSGLLSIQESIYHGKPIVGMSFFLDQHINLKKCVEKGFAEALDFKALTVQKVVGAIKKVLIEPSYSRNAKKVSDIFKDQMETPLERAVYWTEYAIRHHGALHLRHSTRNLSWFQNWMLDVIISVFLLVGLFIFSFSKLFRTMYGKLRYGEATKVKKN